ncbi:MAG: acetylesterase [Chloroflexota bacterium]|nr:acetylesterase [Chloroflexota bacterium]
MTADYQHLGIYSDWVAKAQEQQTLYSRIPHGPETQRKVRHVLGFTSLSENPADVQIEARWERDGVAGEVVSWSVGYGPRSEAWLLKPANADGPLPGVVALHDHSGIKYYGKEKIAAGPVPVRPSLAPLWDLEYGGRPYANALAKDGFVVLVHDTFTWGSRRFPFQAMPQELRDSVTVADDSRLSWRQGNYGTSREASQYDEAAALHEHLVEKYCRQLGTTYAGVISHEDRIAVNYLQSRPDVIAERVGCIGLSGGGCRSGLLQATCDQIKAAVVVGMMSTYEALLDRHIASHTWMLFPDGWARYGDWPDLVACRAPSPLLVQYDLHDELFPVAGMRAADKRLAEHYRQAGHPDAYQGEFYPGPHKFDLEMQASAFAWLKRQLRA